ncbi:AHH domain-containing protein [Algoriphagus algorifonticola]|uniref:AHH domain-containing protein n=1 Tax=Algoriphagus algorifonticola TaxID=2593007 RepID=UPI0011A9916F|nr:AHH domain-containing protein [Algoriphagus algorifonticola]
MNKRLGINIIKSAQSREISDFIFDLEASLLTQDSTARKTYTVPFLSKEDRYNTYNLVIVTDSLDQLLDQYILAYEIDSAQYRDFVEHGDILEAGTTIKRYSFSSFFNDSNPLFLERCQGITDENGDPVVCDQVTLDFSSGGGGGGSGSGGVWITPGGGSSGGDGSSSGTGGSSGGGSGTSCTWTITYTPRGVVGESRDVKLVYDVTVTISCGDDPYMRKNSSQDIGMMQCMDCEISDFDFGTPSFTPTKTSTAINRDLGGILTDFHLQYLSNNPTFANEFRSALLADATVDVDAALFTLAAEMNGALTGDFSSQFGFAIEDLMIESSADFSDPGILRIFQQYFDAKYAILRQNYPSWSKEKLFYETSKEAIHLALDAIGLIEGLGTPADLLNAGLYYLEGDRVNGNLSLVAATPVIGFFSTTVKGALRLKGVISGTSIRITQTWVKDGNLIKFGGTRLRIAMGITDPNKHAHHILPKELVDHPVVQKAARADGDPFHINELANGIEIAADRNTTHPAYNDQVLAILDRYLNGRGYADKTPEEVYNFLKGEMTRIRGIINANHTVKMHDLIID